MKPLIIVLAVALSGCKTVAPEAEQQTIIHRIFQRGPIEVRYVELPPTLTSDCNEVPKSKDPKVTFEDEATRLSNGRLAALKECNDRMLEIRKRQGQIVKGQNK